MNQRPQFEYKDGDIFTFNTENVDVASFIALVIATEADHPGTLAAVIRQLALVLADFRLSSSSTNPSLSLKAQEELVEFLMGYHAKEFS
jgi:hypothetical protein